MYKVVCDGNKCRRVKVTKAKKSSLEERIERRMHSEQTRRKSKTRKSPKSPKRKSPKRKSPKRKSPKSPKTKSRKKRHNEAWAKRMSWDGTNNYTGVLKKVPSRTILDERKKRIDAIYNIYYKLLDTLLYWFGIPNPDNWSYPPQYMDREELQRTLNTMKLELKDEIAYQKSLKRNSSRKRKSRKKRHEYDEDWAQRMVTHVGPGVGGGTNNYTGVLKKVPSRTILDERKKRIDAIYKIYYKLLDMDSVYSKNSFGVPTNPDYWRDPPQYMDREELQRTLNAMKLELKDEIAYQKSLTRKSRKSKKKSKKKRKSRQ
jgi:hypothetical protein